MSLFSFLRKNKQESASDDSAFYSRAEEESKAVRGRAKRRKSAQGSQGDEPVDPVLPEKKRARRRLIGAVALVLAAVIGLPMILDSEPKPLADDISIQIPSKDKLTTSNNPRPAKTSPVAASDALDPKEEMVDTPVVPPAAAESKPADKKVAVTATPAQPAEAKAKILSKPEAEMVKTSIVEKPAGSTQAPAQAESKAEFRTEAKSTEKSQDAARAKALLEGKPDPKATEKKSGKFVVQVAALASKDKVDELQSKLKGAGIKSYTQKVATSSGDRTRIRVGPFASKEEAEKVRAKIVKLGLNGTLVPA
ncbi:SPOR domain-containing protein [Noviherbaspirillum sp.]|uniref:SPOR domain-containing protein n=1 Tax=Noviherbaspirillum sp. TaxID=1926288 RepID=UPI002B47CB2D|nr:SPOR domain-containing protein [Noviherbaspirillum sp.]HJV80821.1 SPOR domain-containing protein [Noviherbaspirillum sp.]